MAAKYYLDTAIWRDLHEDRKDRFRPLGEWAFELLRKARMNHDKILYSDLTVDELSVAYDKETINRLFKNSDELLEKVEIHKSQAKEAARLSKQLNIPFGDALHGILARDNKAIMVTRDHHFEELGKIVSVSKPEDLI
jgi:predicted nucleic acid-binding protein